MKTNLIIEAITDKVSKAGRAYKAFKTSEGTMSCFEEKIVPKLVENLGKEVTVEYESRNGYKNITGFYGSEVIHGESITEKVNLAATYDEERAKQASMIMSYCKDLAIAKLISMEEYEAKCKELIAMHRRLSQA